MLAPKKRMPSMYRMDCKDNSYLRLLILHMRIYLILIYMLITQYSFAQNIDINLLKDIHVHRNQNLDKTMNLISDSQYGISLATPLAQIGYAFLKHDKQQMQNGFVVLYSTGLNFVLTTLAKQSIQRKRPYHSYSFIQKKTDDLFHSFPSGHSSNAFNTATCLSLQYKKWYIVAPSLIWASGVAYSRLHLGVHYPSDVIAGSALGASTAYLSYWLNKKIKKEVLRKHKQGKWIWLLNE